MDFHSFFSAALMIRPCSSLVLDDRVDFFLTGIPSFSNCLNVVWFVVGIVATALLATYIFYPAYANTGGGLGYTATVLVGTVKQNQPGKISIQLAQFRFDIILHKYKPI